jgi:acyl-homoserine lactone acylase PvdQ
LGSTWTSKLSPAGTILWNKMLSWDNRSKYGATEPAYFLLWLVGMNRANQKILDTLEWKTVSANQRWALSMLTNPGPFTTQTCYEASSTGSRSCIDFAAEVWNDVATKREYKWGTEFNRLNVKHSVFGGTFLSCLFNLDAPKDGDFSSVNYAGISAPDLNLNEFYCTDVPSMRNLYSFEYQYSLWALPAGNSAHPFSDNYGNLLMQYSRGEYTVIEANSPVYDGRIQQFSP